MVTLLLLIRHASTDAASRLCGAYDVALSEAGRRELEVLLGRPPKPTAPDALYTSTLVRARQVAEALAGAWRLEARVVTAVDEISCGHLEGVRLEEVQRRFPDVWARNESQADADFAWPGGESYRRFRTRILAGLEEIAARHAGRRVAVVTHAGVISQVLGTLRGRSPAAWGPDRPAPLTATEVTWANGRPVAVLTYNDPDWF